MNKTHNENFEKTEKIFESVQAFKDIDEQSAETGHAFYVRNKDENYYLLKFFEFENSLTNRILKTIFKEFTICNAI